MYGIGRLSWTEKADGLISSEEAAYVIDSHGLDDFFPAVLTELKKMKAAYDKYPNGFLKEMAQKKGRRAAEIILCPYTFGDARLLQVQGKNEVVPPYRLAVMGSSNGQLDLGTIRIANGGAKYGTISITNTGADGGDPLPLCRL